MNKPPVPFLPYESVPPARVPPSFANTILPFFGGCLFSGIAGGQILAYFPPNAGFEDSVPCLIVGGFAMQAVPASVVFLMALIIRLAYARRIVWARPWWVALTLGAVCGAFGIMTALVPDKYQNLAGFGVCCVLPGALAFVVARRGRAQDP